MVILHNFRDILDSLPETGSLTLPAFKQNSLKIEFSYEKSERSVYEGQPAPLPLAKSDVFDARIKQARRLTAAEGDCKTVYEVTFDVEGSKFKYKAGDTIGVIPQNDESDVKFILNHLNLSSQADVCYSLSSGISGRGSKLPVHIPVKSTLQHVLTYCIDLRSVLKKLFLLALSKYTKDERERKTLEYLCSKEGSSAYTTHVLNKGLCILDMFTIFRTCIPPIEVLLANLPRLLPRPYSIVNSGMKCDTEVTISFSVMTVNSRKGLTTGWLENIISKTYLNLESQLQNLRLSNEGSNEVKIPIYLRKNLNQFHLANNIATPMVLIGPGTGVAPFIGFLEEREILAVNDCDTKLGETWLFFGCRNPTLDFIYEDELHGFLSRGTLTRLITAFSRVENTDYKYIQDALTQNAMDVVKLINNGATVYICGDLKIMAQQIKDVFVKSFVEHENMTIEEANAKILVMQKDKRYMVDAWS